MGRVIVRFEMREQARRTQVVGGRPVVHALKIAHLEWVEIPGGTEVRTGDFRLR